jgi:ubiquinone biosynthesis protein
MSFPIVPASDVRQGSARAGPRRLRDFLVRRGPTFIKLGQFLALRPDLIPQEYADELIELLDQAPPFPWEQARRIIEEDLGPIEQTFDVVSDRPVAAGSLAQTHFARLRNGREVALKILRPGIHDMVERDLRRARVALRLLKLGRAPLVVSADDLHGELSSWLRQELDLERELANLQRLRRLAAGSEFQRIPKPYPRLSTRRILTSAFLRGTPLSEIVARRVGTSRGEEHQAADVVVDRRRLAERLISATLTQMFEYQFFHADVHPGNLLLLEDESIGYVDFGLCRPLDAALRRDQLRYLTALASGDPNQILRALLKILIVGPRTDAEGFRRDFFTVSREWSGRAAGNDGRFDRGRRSPAAEYIIGAVRAARRNHYTVPADILGIYRALLTVEAVAQRLDGRVNLGSVGRPYFAQLRLRETARALHPNRLLPTAMDAVAFAREGPGRVNEILRALVEGELVVRTAGAEEPSTRRSWNRRTQLVSMAIVSVGLAVLVAAPVAYPTIALVPLRAVLAAALALCYAWLAVSWRRSR